MSREKKETEKNGKAGGKTINLAERFARSGKFQAMFRDGMALVEETATYLDGEGRRAVKHLNRPSAMLYGSESMRLTTRLMQLASWLLLQRAVSDGEMSRQQLLEEKKKIRLETLPKSIHGPGWDDLPGHFVELVARSIALQNRVLVLDNEIYGEQTGLNAIPTSPGVNPVSQQLNLLSTALGAKIKQ
jgi:regulator of CtrA degradation